MCHTCLLIVISLITSVHCYRYPGYYGVSDFPIDTDFASAYSGLTSGPLHSLHKIPETPLLPPGPIDVDTLLPLSEASSTSKSTDKSHPVNKSSVPSYLDNHKNVPDLGKVSGKGEPPKEAKTSTHQSTQRIVEKSNVKSEVKAKESFSMPSMPSMPSIDDSMKIDSDSEKGHSQDTSSAAFHETDGHSAPVHRQNAPHNGRGGSGSRHKHVDNHEQAQQITTDYDVPVHYAHHRQHTSRKRPSRHKNMRIFDYDYDVAYRSDFYWLIPLVIIIGMGVLILPLCSLFMTAMVSNGAINFTGKRRKRSTQLHPLLSDQLLDTLIKVNSAIDALRSTFQ